MPDFARDLHQVQKSATPDGSRNRIETMGDGCSRAFRQLPADSRRRGLPAIGFELELPDALEVVPVPAGETCVRCRETRGGRTVGELEIVVFRAALIVDRDGCLERKASEVANDGSDDVRVAPAVPIELPGASGYRAEVVAIGRERPPLPYTHVFAMASHELGVDGGVLVVVRSAQVDWPAAERLVESLQIFTRKPSANDTRAATAPVLPIVGRDDD
jgi:hypothetical protein